MKIILKKQNRFEIKLFLKSFSFFRVCYRY